jgi:hypothetical protein
MAKNNCNGGKSRRDLVNYGGSFRSLLVLDAELLLE